MNVYARINRVKLFLKLFIIMGVTWIFEVISWLVSGYNWNWYWVIFDMINILQAIVIFIIFVCKKETISSLEQKYPSFKSKEINYLKLRALRPRRVTLYVLCYEF